MHAPEHQCCLCQRRVCLCFEALPPSSVKAGREVMALLDRS